LRELVYPVLELREEKWIFVKVEGGKVDFFLFVNPIHLLMNKDVYALLKKRRKQVH